jgi:hypothetical protein
MHFNNIIYWLFCALCVAQSPPGGPQDGLSGRQQHHPPGGPQDGLSGRTHQLQPGGLWLPGANDDDQHSASDSTDTSDDDCYSLDEEEKSLPEHRFEKR